MAAWTPDPTGAVQNTGVHSMGPCAKLAVLLEQQAVEAVACAAALAAKAAAKAVRRLGWAADALHLSGHVPCQPACMYDILKVKDSGHCAYFC